VTPTFGIETRWRVGSKLVVAELAWGLGPGWWWMLYACTPIFGRRYLLRCLGVELCIDVDPLEPWWRGVPPFQARAFWGVYR
jgi:hypothetical protein